MKHLIKKLKELGFAIIIFIPILIVYTLLIYKNIIDSSDNALRLTSFFVLLVYFLIVGILTGIIEKKKGIINGIIISSILIIIGFIFLRNESFKFIQIIKYLAFMASSTLGSILGVNIAHAYFKRKVTKHYLKNKIVK